MMDIVVGFADTYKDAEFKHRCSPSSLTGRSMRENMFSPWVHRSNQILPDVMHAPKVSNKYKVTQPVPGDPTRTQDTVINVSQDSLPI